MPDCLWRDRPADATMCTTAADAGQTLCPRHRFMDQLRKEKRHQKELAKGVTGGQGAPKSSRDLISRGYVMVGSSECAGCGQLVAWWLTPKGKRAPYNQMPHSDAPAVSHFATCSRANSFRRAG